MMRTIPLRAVPNQRMSFSNGRDFWELELKVAAVTMICSVWLNNEPVVLGSRVVAGVPLIPYRRLAGSGNFVILTDGDQEPWWELFETSQQLVFSDSASALVATPIRRAPFTGQLRSVVNVTNGRVIRGQPGQPDKLLDDNGNNVISVRRLDGVMSHGWQGDVPLFSRVRSNLFINSGNASIGPWSGSLNLTRQFFPNAPSLGGSTGATWISQPNEGWFFEQRLLSPVTRPGSLTIFAAPLQPAGGRFRVYLWVPGSQFDFFAEVDLYTLQFRGVAGFSNARMSLLPSLPGCVQVTLSWSTAPAQGAYLVISNETPTYLLSDWFLYAAQIDDSGTNPGIYFPTESAPLTRVDYGFQSGELRVNWDDSLFTSATWSGSAEVWGRP